MKKGIKKFFLPLLMVFVLLLGQSFAFAEDDDDQPIDPSQAIPEVTLVNGPVFDVSPGAVNKVEIKLRNNSAFIAKSVVIQPSFPEIDDTPFTVSFDDYGNRINALSSRSETTITLYITMEKTAATKNYPITLNYTYFNDYNRKFSGTNTIYARVKNVTAAPEFELEEVKVTPTNLNAGSVGQISGYLRNHSAIGMYDVEISLDGLATDGISVVNGLGSKKYDRVGPASGSPFAFQIMAGASMKSGNYPIPIKVKYKDDMGKEYESSQSFYINVGGSGGEKAALEIQNMQEPTGVYGANQSFTVEFDLSNISKADAKNVKVTAAGVGENGVVPKSSSIKSISLLKAGETQHFVFAFAATGTTKTQNHGVEITVEYDDGSETPVVFKQYAGANINNPEADEDDKDAKTSKPKIIVSDYTCNPLIVMAGQEFDLNLVLTNTHKEKEVRNIKMFLTLSEETSSDSEKTGNIFTPVDSSNTFYFDVISPKGTVQKQLRLFVVPDAQPKTYTLTVNFEYEDVKGNEFTATELLGINVKQKTQLEFDEFALPPQAEVGMPVSVSFNFFNTGKTALKNLMIRIDGDVESTTKSTYIGNLDSGSSDYYEAEFTPIATGDLPVSIVLSYDDPTGETIETRRDFVLSVTEPMMDPMMEGMDMEVQNQGPSKTKLIGIIIGCIILLAIIILAVKLLQRNKRKKEEAFLADEDDLELTDELGEDSELMDEFEEDFEDTQEGTDADEHD